MVAKLLPVILVLAVSSSLALAQDQDEPPAEEAPAGPVADSGMAERPTVGTVAQPATALNPPAPGKLTLQGLGARLSQARDRGERLRARVNVLKDAILRGGPSADASLVHVNRMGDQFRLIELRYIIDGTVVYSQRDESGTLHEKKTIDILDGPIAPGPHTLRVEMIYRGHGYGPFKYLKKQTFNVDGSQSFNAATGELVQIKALAYERDGAELANKPAVSFKTSTTRAKARPAAPAPGNDAAPVEPGDTAPVAPAAGETAPDAGQAASSTDD